ncbi:MAG: glycosyltransferase family A protein [Chloroflexota bacterium]
MPAAHVTVLMRARNSEATLSAAIESVLAQTYTDFELLIIDDASTDSTSAIATSYMARDPRVQLIESATHLGVAEAANMGLRQAKGSLIAVMDSDDWCVPERLQLQVSFLSEHPEVVICGGSIEVCDQSLRPILPCHYHLDDRAIRAHLFRYSPFAHSAVMYRKGAALSCDGYRRELTQGAEDYDFYFRIGHLGKFANLAQTLVHLRTSSDSFSRRSRGLELATFAVRVRAVFEYGYRPSPFEAPYSLALLASTMMPAALRFWLFALLRHLAQTARNTN